MSSPQGREFPLAGGKQRCLGRELVMGEGSQTCTRVSRRRAATDLRLWPRECQRRSDYETTSNNWASAGDRGRPGGGGDGSVRAAAPGS